MLEASLDAIVAMDHEGRVVEWNAAAESTFGYTRDEALDGQMGDLIVPPELREAHRKGLARYLETGEAHVMGKRLEMPAIRKDGTEFPVELTITRVGGADPPLFMGNLRDITDLKTAEVLLDRRVGQQLATASLGGEAMVAATVEEVAARAAQLGSAGLLGGAVRIYGPGAHDLADSGADADELRDALRRIAARAIAEDETAVGEVEASASLDAQRLIATPIIGGDGPLGAVAASVPAASFTESDMAFVESIAAILAGASVRSAVFAELQTSREQLDVIFRNVAEAITAQTASGELAYANDAAARLTGFDTAEELISAPVEEIVGRFEVMDDQRRPLPFDQLPGRQTLRTGQTHEAVVVYRIKATGEEKWSRVRSSPVRNERGEVAFAINIVRDITEEHREEREARFLARVSAVLGSSLDYEVTLRRVADLVVPEFADWCTVETVEPDRTLRPIAVAHTDPAKVDLVGDFRGRYTYTIDDDLPLAHVIRTGHRELLPDIPDELLEQAIPDPDDLEAIRRLGIRSSLIVALPARGRILGAISMAMSESGRAFQPADVTLLEEVARRAAVAIDNARLFAERNHIAQTLQRSLLPPYLPEVPGLDIAATYRAALAGTDVGGDFYDVFRFDEDRWAVVLGDVQGKGVEAASLVGLARHTLRAAALTASRPQRVLRLLNQALIAHPTDRLCTAALALISRTAGGATVQVAVAGHAPPLIRRVDGTVEPVEARGTILGCFEDIDVDTGRAELGVGDALVLYSDGAVGRGDPLVETMARYLATAGPPGPASALAEHVGRSIAQDQPDGPQDDVTLVVVTIA